MKKTSPKTWAYIRTRIIDFKEKEYAVKEIDELLNVVENQFAELL